MSYQYPNNHGSYPMPYCNVWAMYAAHGAQYMPPIPLGGMEFDDITLDGMT